MEEVIRAGRHGGAKEDRINEQEDSQLAEDPSCF